jgi:hypothetical protein
MVEYPKFLTKEITFLIKRFFLPVIKTVKKLLVLMVVKKTTICR